MTEATSVSGPRAVLALASGAGAAGVFAGGMFIANSPGLQWKGGLSAGARALAPGMAGAAAATFVAARTGNTEGFGASAAASIGAGLLVGTAFGAGRGARGWALAGAALAGMTQGYVGGLVARTVVNDRV